jgi:hypothetical protein
MTQTTAQKELAAAVTKQTVRQNINLGREMGLTTERELRMLVFSCLPFAEAMDAFDELIK